MNVGVDEAWDDDAAGEILKGFVGVLRGEEGCGTDGCDGVVGDEDGACVEVDGAGFVEGEDCCVCVEHFSFSFFFGYLFFIGMARKAERNDREKLGKWMGSSRWSWGHLSSEVQYLYAPMGLWLLMMLLVVVLLMCMRLGDLRPIIASFDGRRPCYRNGLCWREYMYLGRNPYRMLGTFGKHLWSALFAAKHKIVLCAKRNQARIYLEVGKGLCKVSIPVVLAMHVFLQVIYARI